MSHPYILVDSQHHPLARGYLESPPDTSIWEVRVLDGGMEAVLEHEIIQLIGLEDSVPNMVGRILRQKGDIIALETIKKLGQEVRENLRVRAKFQTFIYPLTGSWTGQTSAVVHDLSCGGVAFFCGRRLAMDEDIQMAISLTEPPLLVEAKILRLRPSNSSIPLYSAKFTQLVAGQEHLLREAVFSQQIMNYRKPKADTAPSAD